MLTYLLLLIQNMRTGPHWHRLRLRVFHIVIFMGDFADCFALTVFNLTFLGLVSNNEHLSYLVRVLESLELLQEDKWPLPQINGSGIMGLTKRVFGGVDIGVEVRSGLVIAELDFNGVVLGVH